MNSIRVHSSAPGHPEFPRYLVLALAGPGRISVDLTPLGPDLGLASLTLTQDALYDVLTGQDLATTVPGMSLSFYAQGEELVITACVAGQSATQEFRVWLAEVALGWNVLSRSANSWI